MVSGLVFGVMDFECRVERVAERESPAEDLCTGLRAQYFRASRFVVCGLGLLVGVRCLASVAHIRQSRPDYGIGFKVKALNTF